MITTIVQFARCPSLSAWRRRRAPSSRARQDTRGCEGSYANTICAARMAVAQVGCIYGRRGPPLKPFITVNGRQE